LLVVAVRVDKKILMAVVAGLAAAVVVVDYAAQLTQQAAVELWKLH
jgi:hypothetical protein